MELIITPIVFPIPPPSSATTSFQFSFKMLFMFSPKILSPSKRLSKWKRAPSNVTSKVCFVMSMCSLDLIFFKFQNALYLYSPPAGIKLLFDIFLCFFSLTKRDIRVALTADWQHQNPTIYLVLRDEFQRWDEKR